MHPSGPGVAWAEGDRIERADADRLVVLRARDQEHSGSVLRPFPGANRKSGHESAAWLADESPISTGSGQSADVARASSREVTALRRAVTLRNRSQRSGSRTAPLAHDRALSHASESSFGEIETDTLAARRRPAHLHLAGPARHHPDHAR